MTPVRLAFVVLAGIAAPLAAIAQDQPPQVERWELMDEIGKNTQTMGEMVKGEKPYDAAAVEAALDVLVENGRRFATLFPEGSETGHDTRALPAIWENRAEFDEQNEAMVAAASAARGPAAEGLEAFAPAFRDLGRTCRACHTDFRAEKE